MNIIDTHRKPLYIYERQPAPHVLSLAEASPQVFKYWYTSHLRDSPVQAGTNTNRILSVSVHMWCGYGYLISPCGTRFIKETNASEARIGGFEIMYRNALFTLVLAIDPIGMWESYYAGTENDPRVLHRLCRCIVIRYRSLLRNLSSLETYQVKAAYNTWNRQLL